MTRPDDLIGIPLFASLSDADRADLANWFDSRSTSAGVRLIGEGAAGYSFFVLTEGSAEVTVEGEKVADLGPGDFFGEIAIIGDGYRSATVTMASPGKVLVMFGTDFRRLQDERPEIASLIEDAMRKRLEASG
jgi:CRP/FNR family transcriptional regulator, cyclic AMP receptor protein